MALTGIRGLGDAVSWADLRQLFRQIFRLLDSSHRRALFILAGWAFVVSVLELAVAAGVFPYLACLTRNDCPAFPRLFPRDGPGPVLFFSLVMTGLLLVKALVRINTHRLETRFHQEVQRNLALRLMAGYLHRDWSSFQARSPAAYLLRCGTTAVDAAYTVHQCVLMVASGLTVVMMTALCLWVDPAASLTLIIGFLLISALLQWRVGREQARQGHRRQEALNRWHVAMGEAFAIFRELRIRGAEPFFLRRIDSALEQLARANRQLAFLPILPTVLLDLLVFLVVIGVVLLWLFAHGDLAGLLPYLLFYALAARALLPAAITLLTIRSMLHGGRINVELVLGDLADAERHRVAHPAPLVRSGETTGYRLRAVTFGHDPDRPPLFNGVGLELDLRDWVGIVGASGTGKSSLIELLAGLVTPQQGEIVLLRPGGSPPDAPKIAYLPQQTALLDASVRENITLGEPDDEARLWRVLELVQLDGVVRRLPGGLDGPVGVGGVQLSGGERQRLALARALYGQPEILLLDEATSALDEATEEALFLSLRAELRQTGVILVTHRPANLRHVGRTCRLTAGEVILEGSRPNDGADAPDGQMQPV